ncbi:MAG: 1-acyl-sn-glycerol-3-phosphate acyltransferase [Cytophagales bacterium]|nr:MAG: 1-acyl-sn-glycerol-3-phosphate acyltransferase [Cytophagales bacterium]
MWRKILGWVISPFYVIIFFTILCFFHPIQYIAFRFFGYQAHKRSVDYMIYSLVYSLYLMGVRYRFDASQPLPKDKPLIIISNHQSMFDIPIIGYLLDEHHPKYVTKRELASGIPSISFNIRHGGSAIIDRKDTKQALMALKSFGEYLEKTNRAGCIFPEGTRSRTGEVKPFKPKGLMMLLRAAPNAVVVPVAIDGAWEIMRYNAMPVPFGMKISATVLPTISREGKTPEQILEEAEAVIKQHLGQS